LSDAFFCFFFFKGADVRSPEGDMGVESGTGETSSKERAFYLTSSTNRTPDYNNSHENPTQTQSREKTPVKHELIKRNPNSLTVQTNTIPHKTPKEMSI
jgi:hypothetical protein